MQYVNYGLLLVRFIYLYLSNRDLCRRLNRDVFYLFRYFQRLSGVGTTFYRRYLFPRETSIRNFNPAAILEFVNFQPYSGVSEQSRFLIFEENVSHKIDGKNHAYR